MITASIIKPNLSKSISKTRYTVTSSSWSASANADGYYTYSVSLSPSLNTSYAPDTYLAGSTDSTAPTDTEKGQYAYVERCRLSGSTSLTLYAKTKPTSTFYIYVEGTNGTGSANIEGNVVKPNHNSYVTFSTSEEFETSWKWLDGKTIYGKTFYVSALPNNASLNVTTTEMQYKNFKFMMGYAKPKTQADNERDSEFRVLPFASGGPNDIRVDITNGKLRILTFADWSSYCAYITVFYTISS